MTQITEFGKTATGALVQRVMLRSEKMQVAVLTLGATLQSVRLDGVPYDLTIATQNVADAEGAMCYYGSLIAPVVNRLTGATAQVGGQTAQFEKNFLGKHVLHSGLSGAQHQVWDIADASDSALTLALQLTDGQGGFAGNRDVTARFTLNGARLQMDVTVKTDAVTLWNAANHSYWNLDGSADYAGHSLELAAGRYLPTDSEFIPTGEIADVTGTDFDFRMQRSIAPQKPPLDNSFCLGSKQEPLREVLSLRGASGVTLRLSTTEAAVQLYDCRHDGFAAVAIEAQNWPDAPNKAGFPSIELGAGQSRTQTTVWHFSKA
jgi:aldose 1-epimerase